MSGRGTMEEFDYIVVGAGSAGCVLTDRLSRDPRARVLLLEAGKRDSHPYVGIPKGIAKLRLHPEYSWCLPVEPSLGRNSGEVWPRGRMLGGTSSLNGMYYVRGQPADYDSWAADAGDAWSWQHMHRVFRQMEDHELGASEERGIGGPLRVTLPPKGSDVDAAVLRAGESVGLPLRQDLNAVPQGGIGYLPLTVKNGRRWSSADAFLKPAIRRPNVKVVTQVHVDRVLLEGRRVVGVAGRRGGEAVGFRCKGEVILSAGALKSPQILQLSGIGPGAMLQEVGVPLVHAAPAVGAGMNEHLSFTLIHRLNGSAGENREYRGLRLAKNVLRYYALHSGVLSYSTFLLGGFAKTRPDAGRADIQFFVGALSFDSGSAKAVTARVKTGEKPGITCFAYYMHPESRGSVGLRSPDPAAPPLIRPNWLATPRDRQASVETVKRMRELLAAPALQPYMGDEVTPGPAVRTDAEILAAFTRFGSTANHAVATCAMGSAEGAAIDGRLKVRGVAGLRVVDCSSIPRLPSGNTNAPVMALAWRAAELILEDRRP